MSASISKKSSASASTSVFPTRPFLFPHLSPQTNISPSWSTSNETSVGTTVICPEGGLECGAMVTEKVVRITGQQRLPPGGLGCPGDNNWHAFDFLAPVQEEGPIVNFQACLKSCGSAQYPLSCDVAYEGGPSKIPICPSESTKPCQGSFGGVCSTIPAV